MKFIKKHSRVILYIIVLLSTYICALTGRFLYEHGAYTDMYIILQAPFFAFLGYSVTKGFLDLLFIDINLLVSVFLGSYCSGVLYYQRVSSDMMSLVIGELFIYIALGFTLISVAVFLVFRGVRLSRKKKCVNNGSVVV
ncbi:MAG: hypothetical protein IJC49_06270 [Clostridia bacterium]|nr:hypothetical protein [Clostridia bacterium]